MYLCTNLVCSKCRNIICNSSNLDWNKDSAYPNIKEHKKLETFKDPGEKVKEYDKIWQDIIAN